MCGSRSIKYRSLNVPGSDSSALQTTYFCLGESLGTKLHFIPVGKPAPPRPRKADFLTSPMTSSGDIDVSTFLRASYPPLRRYTSIEADFSRCTRASCRGLHPIAPMNIVLLIVESPGDVITERLFTSEHLRKSG